MLSVNFNSEMNIIGDSEAVAWKEAKDAGAEFITKKWIAEKLKRRKVGFKGHGKKVTMSV